MDSATRKKSLSADTGGIVLRLEAEVELTDEKMLALSSLNRDLRLERTAEGELIAMPPTGSESSARNAGLTAQLWVWAKRDGTGRISDSSGGFTLPNGALRSPDASWVKKSRLEKFTAGQREKYLPLCPDFVVELRSPTDRLNVVKEKMREYIENGAKLGWLIDPADKRVFVYLPGEDVRELKEPDEISGSPVLPGFALDLREIW
ncbi:MAG: Uma2 family endonuclease [Actinomycetota bacterium]|nr:Uma2 family endonuclease [Rubrobacter sp.]MDQ3509922.1 Uma2 family endonuclease [Actinomycetota bacterium]